MKNNALRRTTRVSLVLCGALLIAVLFVPVWRIDLNAPQYPEGLRLIINANGLGGDVAIVNGLNHYIGMKTLRTEDFIEFTVLPYIIVFFALAIFVTAVVGKRSWLYILFLLFVCFGIVAMIDFWRWEYDYGHHLNPDAPIVVPGMAYQPPLIGFKQLLNFGAYSVPGPGGWLFVGTGVLMLLLVAVEWKANKKTVFHTPAAGIAGMALLLFISSCAAGPEPIATGKDQCDFCRMTISDNRFGAEIVTKKGRVYKFDDAHCFFSFLQKQHIDSAKVKDIYFTDFGDGHSLINAAGAFFLQSEALKSPMEGNVAAFASRESAGKAAAAYKGNIINWNELHR